MGVETLLLAGAATQAFGAIKGGSDQAAIADYNAKVAKQEGAAAVQEASLNEQLQRRDTRKILARRRLLAGANGVDVSGSLLEETGDTARESELDALAIRFGGTLSRNRAQAGADLSRAEGDTARATGFLGAAGAGLGGFGDVQAFRAGQVGGRRRRVR